MIRVREYSFLIYKILRRGKNLINMVLLERAHITWDMKRLREKELASMPGLYHIECIRGDKRGDCYPNNRSHTLPNGLFCRLS